MYLTDELLEKLNRGKDTQPVTLSDIMLYSFAEVKALADHRLSWGEANFLYQQAQTALKENKMTESRILSRANPQLANAIRLGISHPAQLRSYNDLFGGRAGKFVKPGSVSSMFSPAGYLTELYREARKLHAPKSAYHLDQRRPDLASLSLSQSNLDVELSTLSLSNELLLMSINQQNNTDDGDVLEMISSYRQTGATPYHLPFDTTRQAILLQDEAFSTLNAAPEVTHKADNLSLLAMQANISPGLYAILVEPVSVANSKELFAKNFGEEAVIDLFTQVSYLASFYEVPVATLLAFDSYINKDGTLKPDVIIGKPGKDFAGHLNSYNLYHYKDDTYFAEVNFNERAGKVSIKIDDGSNNGRGLATLASPTLADKVYQSDNFLLPEVNSGQDLDLYVYRYKENSSTSMSPTSRAVFGPATSTYYVTLLKLNKLVRLHKVSGFSPADIRLILESKNEDLAVDDTAMQVLCYVQQLTSLYDLNVADALVLYHATISRTMSEQGRSQFDALFNTPLMNGKEFTADGTQLDLTPGASEDHFSLAVLKRAFRVNESELHTLWKLACGNKSEAFTRSLKNLSTLYRVRLLADAHRLTVNELALLLSVSPYASAGIGGLSDAQQVGLLRFLAQYTQWLTAQGWAVNELYLMSTDRYSTALSPDIESLITTLRDGLASQNLSQLSAEEVIRVAAPFIAAGIKLDSIELATGVLQWIDQLKPQALTVAAFLSLANRAELTPVESLALVNFCQVMGQLTLIVRGLRLSAGELSLAVTQPGKIHPALTLLPHDITTIRALARFHDGLQRCGASATELLSALGNGTLTPAQLAQAMALDEQMAVQGLHQYDNQAAVFNSWVAIDVTLKWVDIAITLGITPAGVAALTALNYTDPAHQPSYTDWVSISQILQGGLSRPQTQELQAAEDQALSAALSAYAIKNVTPDSVTNRDQLYSWLLLDNQVSAQVKTTRVAEAIASVQLYVNRALSGQEEPVDYTVKSRQFFTDWEVYNKRYSTWAGLSQLAYYPENYIDPTLRIGQTNDMDKMLQSLSQSQLNPDTVEDAFKSYLTGFEEIANLDIISAYHDNVNVHQGMTYFIGSNNNTPKDYYWRRTDHSKAIDGKIVANAWSDWEKIECAIAYDVISVRPVIYKSRLYICWLEVKEKAENKGENIIYKQGYELKLSHIRYDGTWSKPIVYPANSLVEPISENGRYPIELYCAEYQGEDTLILALYRKSDSPQQTLCSGMQIFYDLSSKIMSKAKIELFLKKVYHQFDTLKVKKVNNRYAELFEYPWELTAPTTATPGEFYLTGATGFIEMLTITPSSNSLTLKFKPTISRLIKSYRADRDLIYSCLFANIDKNNNAYNTCVIHESSDKKYASAIFVNSENGKNPRGSRQITLNSTEFPDYWEDKIIADVEVGGFIGPAYQQILSKYKGLQSYIDQRDGTPVILERLRNDCKFKMVHPKKNNRVMGHRKEWETAISTKKSTINVEYGKRNVQFVLEGFLTTSPPYSFDEMVYSLNTVEVVITDEDFLNKNQMPFNIKVSLVDNNGVSMGACTFSFTVTKVVSGAENVISLYKTELGAQYMQYSVYRTRLNTLFSRKLITEANKGIDSVLSFKTQHLPEPPLGKGFYVKFVLPPYDESTHGQSRAFTLELKHVVDNDAHVIYSGILSDDDVSVNLFIPLDDKPLKDVYRARVFLKTDKIGDFMWGGPHFRYINGTAGPVEIHPSSLISMFKAVIVQNERKDEPMDFNGANALYFWEMFYYVPMMVFQRLLQENNFTEATQWLKYVWSPEGYLEDGRPADFQWNVRPLEEETSWNPNPLDSMDPDAVAQADPMHYKVATFMGMLDLLMARGDAAYRQLERDSLNEAKMWYVQALTLLGEEPYLPMDADWKSPALCEAADLARQSHSLQALERLRHQHIEPKPDSANSLTDLFLPQHNAKLTSYWQMLAQRFYNLRHNLSIDGQLLSLPIYAAPADPTALLSAAVNSSQGGSAFPQAMMPLHRFPIMLERAQGMVRQLMQFGSTLLGISERQDAEALSELLQRQGSELMLQSIALQKSSIAEIDADSIALEASRGGVQSRLNSYTALYDTDVSGIEKQVMNLYTSSSAIATGANALHMAAAALDMVPNIYGFAVGGTRFGAITTALAIGAQISSDATRVTADRLAQSEAYRRRRQEWDILRNSAASDLKQIDASLAALAIRREAALLQKTYLETQQSQVQAQLSFLQNKFTNAALYNWLRGKLSAIYYQFYDLTVSQCLMAQESYQWALGLNATFIRTGAWQGNYAGLMAGETLMLNLAQMEQAYLQKNQREKEVTRTVCLSEIYAGLPGGDHFILADKINELVSDGKGRVGTESNGLKIESKQLQATLKLSDLNIRGDYPDSLGKTRRIKQVSVTLPALVGPYQDVRAVLGYGGSVVLPQGCNAVAVSHGMNDSGQFQLDFNDSRWLPFEGIPVEDGGTLTLSFPGADGEQQALLLTLTDIILHIRYTIIH